MLDELKGLIEEKYERNGWPAQPRPDIKAPEGWSMALLAGTSRPRSNAPSPDGRQIAFIWDAADASDLYVMDSLGGWPRRLTFDRNPVAYWADDAPQWSADGAWIAFTNKGHVWVVAAEGGRPRQITGFTNSAGSPRWLPDGRLLITHSREERSRILVTDRAGSWPQLISQGPGHDVTPQPAPDGQRIAYVHHPPDDRNRLDIMVADLTTGEIRPLTDTPDQRNLLPRWSTDGTWIAYVSDRSGGFRELFVANPVTGAERQITHLGQDIAEIAWGPDGRVACIINRGGAYHLAVIDIDNGEVSDLRSGQGVHSNLHWLADGRTLTFEWEDPTHPADIYRLDIETGETSQLTFSRPPVLNQVSLVTPERVTYTSFDGLDIPAFLYRPEKPNGAAVVYPHGGPTSQYVLEFDIVAQYFAAKGYTWIAPNFRGSTGYGLDFERANHGVWGIDDTKDCLAAADYLAGLEGIDRERIAIFGASYGSYMAVCALAYDDQHRFACGVAKYGDCNILSSWAQGDLVGREDLERMMGHPTRNQSGYRAGSPVWQVEKIEKPLFIAHGLEDARVHPLQSEELVEALKRAGKTFEYKTYPNEGHGLLRRASKIDFHTRLERFFDWYLL